MALNRLNSSNVEQLALKGLITEMSTERTTAALNMLLKCAKP